ncbi:MAG: F0F1 ATP synthase subunit alpha [bacterium]|nr:F0F1 ATP synthase subunit alpha [bacterium]
MKEIIEQLRAELTKIQVAPATAQSVGRVHEVSDGIARVSGLDAAMANELVRFDTDSGPAYGLALNLEADELGIVVLDRPQAVQVGDAVTGEGRVLDVPTGEALLGRVVTPLGEPIDGQGTIRTSERRRAEKIAPGVIARQSVNTSLATGITIIDALTPIGRGQRQLIIGDRGTGKTAIIVDSIINQARIARQLPKGEQPVICIYVAIGQKRAKIARLRALLQEHNALANTIIVAATASDPAPLNFLAPYAGVAMAEYFMDQGRDVLIAYDDLSKHAWAYREISLLLRRPPGREAYPGDIFYLHSRLLERAAKMNDEQGGGSITALPVIETQAGDVSAYIPTNVISITDGQIFLESDLFYAGTRPAMNVGLSVSRVGGAAQIKAMKKIAGQLRLDLAQYRELAAFAQFGSDLDEGTRKQIDRGERLTELMKQPQFQPRPVAEQVVVLYAATNGYFDQIAVTEINQTAAQFVQLVQASAATVLENITTTGVISEADEEQLIKLLTDLSKT